MSSEGHQAKSCLMAAMAVFLVMDTAVIATRVYVRAFMIRAFGWDDAALCLAHAGLVIAFLMGFTAIHYGYAYDGPPRDWPNYDQHKAQTYLYANQLALYLTSGIAKLAVALVLCRLAINRRFKIILAASVAVVLAWTFTTTLFSSWLCLTNGAANYVSSPTCTAMGLFRTVSNIFIDYFYALLPIPIVRRAKMNTQTKITVCILLGLGMFASAATIAKLVIIVRLSHAASKVEQELLHHQLLTWADVELGLAIFCASAAALRPLLRRNTIIWGSDETGDADGEDTPYTDPPEPASFGVEPVVSSEGERRVPSNASSVTVPSGGTQAGGHELGQVDLGRCSHYEVRGVKR